MDVTRSCGHQVNRCGARWTTVTSGDDGFAHAVADSVLAAGAGQAGRFVAACGRLVVPAALSAPPGRPCLLCAAGTSTHDAAPEPTGRHRRGRGWSSAWAAFP